ncbi:ribonuclease H-like domain, reverse transcriptase, RNA-dependent DNA polymerase [Tanacetum coccineum]
MNEKYGGSDTLWGEAVHQAVYIQNRVPIKTLGDTTPYERWSGKKPNLKHLRVFGCVAHSNVLRRAQQKRDSRSEMRVVTLGNPWYWGETISLKISPDSTSPLEGIVRERDNNWRWKNDSTYEPTRNVKAIKVELDAIEKNQTWSLVDLPVGRKPIGLKWVYKLKRDPSGNILKHKARLVAKGYVQKPRVDFDKVHHLEVKSAFLNGRLEEEVYVTQPEGYVKANHPEKVYKLSKALYGLRQAPRAWNSRLDKAGMADCNPLKSPMEHKEELTKDEGGVSVNPTLFCSIIEGLRYFAHTRPDIAYAVGIVSRFMEKPIVKKYAWNEGSYEMWRKDGRTGGKSHFTLKENWSIGGSKKQQCVALSSYEAEFMAVTTATCQGIWVSRLVQEITGKKTGPFVLYLDNNSAIELIKNPVFHGRKQAYCLRVSLIRECVERGDVVIKHVCSKEQRADILTKPLPRIQFIEMRKMMGVKNITDSELGGKMLA